MFKKYSFEIMNFNKRVAYMTDYISGLTSAQPPFSSVYVCHNMLPQQIMFEEIDKKEIMMEQNMNTQFVTKAKFKTEESYRVACKIQQRRLQILVHSCIYYKLDNNIVSDSQWSSWAKELCIISKVYPDIAEKVIYADQFENFDGSTGMDFTYDKWIENKAKLLLNCQRE